MNAGASLAEEPSLARSLAKSAEIYRFVLAGNATFTLVSVATGARFTFRVRASRDDKRENAEPLFFVSVLTGPSNDDDYEFLGTVFAGSRYVPGRRSRIEQDASSARAFTWFWTRLMSDRAPGPVAEFWHEGRCGRCGRKLTVPESIASGLGPECASRSS